MVKKTLLTIVSILLLFGFYTKPATMESKDKVIYETYEEDMSISYDPYGNVEIRDIEKEKEEVRLHQEAKKNIPMNAGETVVIDYGVVNFKTKPDETHNTYYTIVETGGEGYTNGYYAADGAFLGYSDDGKYVYFIQAGVKGKVATSEVEVLDYNDTEKVKSVSYYHVKDGKLYHYGTTNIYAKSWVMVNMVGYKQSYMSDGSVYYSYDGHYFYDTYAKMIDDYKKDTRENAINKDTPYYNYYQYLSHRSETNITAQMMDNYTNEVLKNSVNKHKSKMLNMGVYFANYEQIYGTNAIMMYALAAHESGWGLSKISQNKNNLFGHAAYDSSAGDSANGYFSPQKSIYSHSRYFVSEGYLDPLDYRYYGAHFGDKASGMNVKYASDPYWGEKAAEFCWAIYDYYQRSSNTSLHSNDAFKYNIAIQNGAFNLNIRKEATTSSSALYMSEAVSHFPYIVLAEVEGQNISGNTKWYKIQSDSTLKSDRSSIVRDNGVYNYDSFYAFIHSSYATIVSIGSGKGPNYTFAIPEMPKENDEYDFTTYLKNASLEVDGNYVYGISPKTTISSLDTKLKEMDASITVSISENNHKNSNSYVTTDMILQLTSASGSSVKYTIIIKGDVNADGNVFATDYVKIKNFIMGTGTLEEVYQKAADVNKDGKVYATDYVKIKNFIMGKGTL